MHFYIKIYIFFFFIKVKDMLKCISDNTYIRGVTEKEKSEESVSIIKDSQIRSNFPSHYSVMCVTVRGRITENRCCIRPASPTP